MIDHDTADDLNVGTLSNYTPPSYDIAPEDAHIAAEIDSLDPLSLPSAHEIIGTPKLTVPTTLAALPPRLRDAAQEKMGARVSEAEAVQAVLRENALNVRSKSGFSASADPYWQDRGLLIGEYNSLLDQFDRLAKELSDSIHFEKDENGEAKKVVGLSAARQKAIATRQSDLLYRASLLFDADGTPGVEGKRRLAKSMFESVEKRKAMAAQIAEQQEIDARARQIAHHEHIERKAQGLAGRYRKS